MRLTVTSLIWLTPAPCTASNSAIVYLNWCKQNNPPTALCLTLYIMSTTEGKKFPF